jgi:hypothetical protein
MDRIFNKTKESNNKSDDETALVLEKSTNELLDKLEKDGYDKLSNINKSLPINPSNKDVAESLMNIIQNGANEFREKTGRNMSYAEMRQAYG